MMRCVVRVLFSRADRFMQDSEEAVSTFAARAGFLPKQVCVTAKVAAVSMLTP
jgi:hypothetical protein